MSIHFLNWIAITAGTLAFILNVNLNRPLTASGMAVLVLLNIFNIMH